jgi:hypothetical protein
MLGRRAALGPQVYEALEHGGDSENRLRSGSQASCAGQALVNQRFTAMSG